MSSESGTTPASPPQSATRARSNARMASIRSGGIGIRASTQETNSRPMVARSFKAHQIFACGDGCLAGNEASRDRRRLRILHKLNCFLCRARLLAYPWKPVSANSSLCAVQPDAWRDGGASARLWLSVHSLAATATASIAFKRHQACSSPWRCRSRWCSVQSGTVNSSETLRAIADGWVNRKWWACARFPPQTRHPFDATNRKCSGSRRRLGSEIASVFRRAILTP
jgi:hypothetical protein